MRFGSNRRWPGRLTAPGSADAVPGLGPHPRGVRLPDRAEVTLSVYDARTGGLLERSSVGGRSSWFTFGGDKPQDILPGPIDAYVASLF